MFYGYIVVVNPKPFTSSNGSTFVKTCNCRIHPTSKGQHTQLCTSHPVHSLTINSNVRGTKSTVIGPSHEFFHNFFSRSQAHRLTSSRSQARQIATLLMGLGLESCFVQFVKVDCSCCEYSVLSKIEVGSCPLGGDNILGRHQR